MEAFNFKFGMLPMNTDANFNSENVSQFSYSNVWQFEQFAATSRLIIAPSANHFEVLLELTKILSEPFGILYVLVVSRCNNFAGRYQCPAPINRKDLEKFLYEFQNYLEGDARHNIWIASLSQQSTVVYDRHNLIYAYGALEKFKKVIENKGFNEGKVEIPTPHIHNYNPKFDGDEIAVMNYWQWKQFPLADGDE